MTDRRQEALENLNIATAKVFLLAEVTSLLEEGRGIHDLRDRLLKDEANAKDDFKQVAS